jgi:hypothetical protein
VCRLYAGNQTSSHRLYRARDYKKYKRPKLIKNVSSKVKKKEILKLFSLILPDGYPHVRQKMAKVTIKTKYLFSISFISFRLGYSQGEKQ